MLMFALGVIVAITCIIVTVVQLCKRPHYCVLYPIGICLAAYYVVLPQMAYTAGVAFVGLETFMVLPFASQVVAAIAIHLLGSILAPRIFGWSVWPFIIWFGIHKVT